MYTIMEVTSVTDILHAAARKRKILVILRQKFYLRNTIITFARFSDFSAQVDFHLIGHFLLYSKRNRSK